MLSLSSEQGRGHLAMLLFSALVAGSFSLGHIVANEIAPSAINAMRFALACALMGAFVLAGPGLRRRDFAAPWRYLLLGGFFGLYFLLMFEGLKTAAPVSAAAVFTLVPFMSAGFGYLLLRQVTTPRMAFALSLAALGALWVVFRADISALISFDLGRGEAIYLVGCVCHAIYTPLVRKLNRGETPLVFSFGTLAAGTLLLGLVGFPSLLSTDWSGLPIMVWVTLGYLVIFATAASFYCVQYATLRLPAAKVMAYSYLTPVWVILWEVGLGNGWPKGMVLLGVVATIAALVMLLKDEGAP